MEFLTVPKGREPSEFRRAMTAKYQARVLDMLIPQWACSSCGAAIPVETLVLPEVHYRTLEEASSFFMGVARELASKPIQVGSVPGTELAVTVTLPTGRPIVCPMCKGAPTLRGAEAILYAGDLGTDLVLRITAEGGTQVLANGAPLSWSPALATGFRRDALVRSLGIAREDGDAATGVRLMLEAAQSVPGEKDVLAFLPWLNNQRQSAAVIAMADATMQRYPERADGYFWKAQVRMQESAELRRPALADEAEQLLARALQIEPGHADAAVASANIARIRGRDDQARTILDRLLQHEPTHAVANYTVGLILLPKDPAGALGYFERGERSAPDDPDYPRARAQALLALGRAPEAQVAVQRALEIAPNDPRAQAVHNQIAGDNPLARAIRYFVLAIVFGTLLSVVGIVLYVLHSAGLF